MREKRLLIDGAFYHVTSRTNNKINAFECNTGTNIMLLTLKEAKEKFQFRLANFCVMPNHIHLLIAPAEDTNLSKIMHWIKLISAKRWNFSKNCCNHLWGNRYSSRIIKNDTDFYNVMEYIDQNPVKAGLCITPNEWYAGGAYYTTLIS